MTNDTQQQQQTAVVIPAAQGNRSPGQEIRVREILHVLLKRRMWIVTGAVIGVVFGLALSVLSYVKSQTIQQYAIRTSIALTSQSQNGMFSKDSRDPDSTDFYLAEDMVDAAVFILMSDSMLDRIIEDVNLIGVTARDISNSISFEQYKETQIILINLYWGNGAEGVRILEALNALAPEFLIDTLMLGNVTVINKPTARFVIGGNLNLTRNLVLGIMLGVVMGAAFAILELLLKPTLLTLTDVERRLRVPLLGTIGENDDETPIQTELLSKDNNTAERTGLADSYLAAAYALKRRLSGLEHPIVAITSAERGEGRTVITACLAAALSQIGVRVLAADFDFQNPMLTGLFFEEVEPERSINALYRGETHPRDAVAAVNGTLDLLPALLEREPIPLNHITLDLIRRLRDDYDMILVDTPPVGQIADTMVLNELTELSLFVIQYDGATQAVLKDALKRLDSVDMRVIGSIVNRVKSRLNTHRNGQQSSAERRFLRRLWKRFQKKRAQKKKKKRERGKGRRSRAEG